MKDKRHEVRLRHVHPPALAFMAGANLILAAEDHTRIGPLIAGVICLVFCIWIVCDNLRGAGDE